MKKQFAAKARELHRLIIPWSETQALEKVLEILDKISIPEGKALRCHLSGMHCRGIGDNSFLYVNDIEEQEGITKIALIGDTWKNIRVEHSEMGMWQTYLLMTTIHVMPYFWHGGYSVRTFIFCRSDLSRIRALKGMDLSHIDDSKLQPEVKMTEGLDGKCMGTVSTTYWTAWGGLVREIVTVGMDGDRVTVYGPAVNEALYRYDCGIMF